MCIIIVKPSGVALPTVDILDNCFFNNPDGFGLAYQNKEGVHILKGAMNLQAAVELLSMVAKPKEKGMILHFRMATSGLIRPENCHPLPLSNQDRWLTSLDMNTKTAIAHNGVIFEYTRAGGDYYGYYGVDYGEDEDYNSVLQESQLKSDLSDTQRFVKNTLFGMGRSLFNKQVLKLVELYTESKFAIMTQDEIYLVGKFVLAGGLFYSNLGFEKKHQPTSIKGVASPVKFAKCDLCEHWVIPSTLVKVEDVRLCIQCVRTLGIAQTP